MRNILLLTKKNLSLLLRARASSLIIIFAPLLIMLLLGLTYDTTDKYALNIGITAPSYTDDINTFIALLQEKEFNVIKYEQNIESCIADIKSGLVHTCIGLPENLKVQENAPKTVTFYIDPSRVNLVDAITETVKDKFNLKSQEISKELTASILSTLQETKGKINTESSNLVAIKEKNQAAQSSAQNVKTTLDTVDIAPPTSTYDKSIVDTTHAQLDQSQTKIAQALTKLELANMTTSDRNKVKVILQEVASDLNTTTALLAQNSTGGITALIATIEQDLTTAKTKLQTAGQTISTTKTNLDGTQTTLSEAITSLDAIQASLASATASISSIKVTDAQTIATPINTVIEPINQKGSYLNYLFPALIVLVIMFGSLLLGTTLVMIEKNSPAFFRNYFLPIKKTTFILAIYATNLVLALIQIVIILGIAAFFLQDSYTTFPAVALILFIAATIFTFMGMILGYIFASEETAMLSSISLGSILLFFSGVIFPLEGVSAAWRQIVSFNPFVLTERLIRELFLFNSTLSTVWMDIVILAGYALALFLIIIILESVLHQHLVHRFMKHHHKVHRENDKINK